MLVIPDGWDQGEWMAMFSRHGAPPWPGPRSGLTEYAEENASPLRRHHNTSNAHGPSPHAGVGADSTRPIGYRNPPIETQFKPGTSGNPEGRPRRDKSRKAIIERIASESHVVTDGDQRIERTTLELILHMIRAKAHEGHRKAFRIHARLLIDYGEQEPIEDCGFLIVGEPESDEEWERKTAEQQRPHREGTYRKPV